MRGGRRVPACLCGRTPTTEASSHVIAPRVSVHSSRSPPLERSTCASTANLRANGPLRAAISPGSPLTLRAPSPALKECERGAPTIRLLKLSLSFLAELVELVGTHQRQELLLERGNELQRQTQVGMSGRKREELGAYVSFDTELAQQLEVHSPRTPISPAEPKGVLDQDDEPLESGRRRIEVPGSWVGILENDRPARPSETHIRLHLLVRATERTDFVAGVHEVERVCLELARKQIVLDQPDVRQAFLSRELLGGSKHRLVDVGSRHLPFGADPLTQDAQPPENAAADIQRMRTTAVADLFEQPSTARLPDSRLQPQSLELRYLSGKQVSPCAERRSLFCFARIQATGNYRIDTASLDFESEGRNSD
jgi:hypothetical protein